MKTSYIIYPALIVFAFVVPVTRYYLSTPEVNACVLDYTQDLNNSYDSGYIYSINGRKHIEPMNSIYNKSLKKYLIGRSKGCMMYSDNPLDDLNNTVYCTVSYIIQHIL